MEAEKLNLNRISRNIKRMQNSVYNALLSIYDDSIFVSEIAELWKELPLVANLRCGLWYSNRFETTCYFKSTDGHCNNWSFSISRLNLHVAHLCAQRGGCIIVDSTRKGKRFPDSMSKTIPIWTCVMNRVIDNHRQRLCQVISINPTSEDLTHHSCRWDCSLHLPPWVSPAERSAIEDRLGDWTKQLEATGIDFISFTQSLRKPLRPLWISQKSLIWMNEVPDFGSWDFSPVILVSASNSDGISSKRTISDFSWHYMPGAGDDEESWSRKLTPRLFWDNMSELINSGPDSCNQKIAVIVEKDRAYHAEIGHFATQISPRWKNEISYISDQDTQLSMEMLRCGSSVNKASTWTVDAKRSVVWLGPSRIAVTSIANVADAAKDVDCLLNCGCLPVHTSCRTSLHLPILTSKFDRFSLVHHLPSAIDFARVNLKNCRTLLICCQTGEDISVCVALTILICLFDGEGHFDNGKLFEDTIVTKWEMRRRLVFVCKFVVSARPSRGNLKQVFDFLCKEKLHSFV